MKIAKIKSIFFIFILFLPLLGWQFDIDRYFPLQENRSMSPKPQLKINRDLVELTKEIDSYFNDHLGFRSLLVALNRLIKVRILKSSPNPTVTLGKNNWLFFTPELDRTEYMILAPFTQEELAVVQKNFEDTASFFTKKGVKFYLLIAPNSSSIYPEYLPDYLTKVYQNTRLKQMTKYFQDHGAKFNYIDPTNILLSNKDTAQLYYKNDLHWNQYGGYLVYMKLMDMLHQDFPNLQAKKLTDYSISWQKSDRKDLQDFIGVVNFEPENHPIFSPLSDSKMKYIYQDCQDIYNRCGDIETVVSDPKLPVLVMYRDSYGSWLIPFLGEHFKKADFLWQVSPINPVRVWQEKANLVIFEVSERNLWTFTEKQFKTEQ
jgi:hypothetical protein